MKVEIANPIYDVVFKYMMDDNAVAKLLISSIIQKEIISLEARPQEYSLEKREVANKETLTVHRLDFSAKIKTENGYKLVIIELQKASLPTDIMRFRSYLGKQYANESNVNIGENEKIEPFQIYCIYFLGKDLQIHDTPVIECFPVVRDATTKEEITEKSSFIESLTHKGWIVQISCLKRRRRNETEMLLSVFDQNNITDDHRISIVNEEDFPEKHKPLICRLREAASNLEVKTQMRIEDEFLRYLKDVDRGAYFEGRLEGYKDGLIEALSKRRKAMEITVKQKDMEIKQKDKENEALKQEIEKLRKKQHEE
jgi:hypothetical protein